MAITDDDLYPPEPIISGAHTLIRNGLMQSDLDAQFHQIKNLDTSNLVLDPLQSQGAVPNKWFNSYDMGSQTFGILQPAFTNIAGNITLAQQRAITNLGTITRGVWNGTALTANYVPTLDNIRSPVGSLDVAQQQIINLADPVNDQDAVNLRFFNLLQLGLNPKGAVRAATVENIHLVGLLNVDGVNLNDNDRVLVKDQTGDLNFQNGIWNAHPGSWTRSTDMDEVSEFDLADCFVLEGDTHVNETWLQTTTDPQISPPTPSNNGPYAVFVLLSRSGSFQTGNGLDHTGNTIFAVGTTNRISVSTGIDIDINYAGQDSIGTVGTIGTGTWEGDVIESDFGGTGVDNHGFNITIAGDFTTSLAFGAPAGSFLSFSLLGATTLTLPVIGTLATLGGNETFTNKHISASQIDSGVLLITQGGTSANNAVAALNNILPSQIGQAGKFLTTDGGGNITWATPSSTP